MSQQVNPRSYKPTISVPPRLWALGSVVKADVDYDAWDAAGESAKDLLGDTWQSLYQFNPTIKDEDAIHADRKVNRRIMEWAMDQESFGETRRDTVGNLPSSLVGAGFMWDVLASDENIGKAQEMEDLAEEQRQQAQDAETQAKTAQRNAARLGQQLAAHGDQMTPEIKAEIQSQIDQLNETMQDAEGAAQQLLELASQNAAQAQEILDSVMEDPVKQRVMNTAVVEAEKGAEQMNAVMRSWGVEPDQVSYEDVNLLVHSALGETGYLLARTFGRLKGIARATIKGIRSMTGVTAEVGLTKNVQHILPTELARLSEQNHKMTRYKAIKELVTVGMLGWIPLEEKKREGSFVMAVDESGSVSRHGNALQKSLALAIAKAVQEEGERRRFSLFGFSSSIYPPVTEDADWKELINWGRHYAGGGTNLNDAILQAIACADGMTTDEDRSLDIVILSDGIAGVRDTTWERLEELKDRTGARLFYLAMDHRPDDGLSKHSDRIMSYSVRDSFDELVARIAKFVATHD